MSGKLTIVGDNKMEQLAKSGRQVQISHMGIATGNFNELTENSTSLINEIAVEPIFNVKKAVISGGLFFDRKMQQKYQWENVTHLGLYDTDGVLIIYAPFDKKLIPYLRNKVLMVQMPILKKMDSNENSNIEDIKRMVYSQDYSLFSAQMGDFNNIIYKDLVRSVFATLEPGTMLPISDVFIPIDSARYTLHVKTDVMNSVGFHQSITIIPDDASDPVTLTRAGTSFETARWITQRSSNAVQSNVFDSVFVRGSVFAVGDVTGVTEHELEDLINANK